MGFLKYINIAALILLVAGCAPSSIKLNTRIDDGAYSMFGRTPGREFFLPVELSDSLVERWEGEVNGNFTNSSVAVSDSFVFVNDLSGRITCFRIDNGKRVGQIKNNGTIVSSPVIHKYLVIYADAYNKENRSDLNYYDISLGKIHSTANIQGRILSQLIKTGEGIIFVTENGIAGLYNFLGHKIWETRTDVYMHSSPALADNRIVFGNDDGEIIIIDAKSGKLIYRKNYGSPFFSGVSISGKTAYIGNDDGDLLAIDIVSCEMNWIFESGARIIANPVMDNEHLIICNLKGEIYKLLKENGSVIWKRSTGGVINASPFLTSNRIIVPDLSGKIHFIDYNSGELTKTITFDSRVRLSPLIVDKYLYIGFDKGILKSYEVFF